MRRGVLLLTPQVCQVLGGGFSGGNQEEEEENKRSNNSCGSPSAAPAVDSVTSKDQEHAGDDVAANNSPDAAAAAAVSRASISDDVMSYARLVVIDDEIDVRGRDDSSRERAAAPAIASEDELALIYDDMSMDGGRPDDVCSPPDIDVLLAEQQHKSVNKRGTIVGVERLEVVNGLFVAEVWLEDSQQQSQLLTRLSSEICAELLQMTADSYAAEMRAASSQRRIDLQMSCCSKLCGVEGHFCCDCGEEGEPKTPIIIVNFIPLA